MIHFIHGLVWGPWLLVLLLGIGVCFTLRSGFFQIRGFKTWWSHTAGSLFRGENCGNGDEERGAGAGGGAGRIGKGKTVTQFQTACTALAATVGTGNIAGVATALAAGGPGALFWMWVSAGIGMMTAYGEAALGIRFRAKKPDGSWASGPMFYLEKGLGFYTWAILYSFFAVLSSLGMGSMVQSNSIGETLEYGFHIGPVLTGFILSVIIFFIIRGGLTRIASVAERLVPWSAGIYMGASLVVILSYYDRIPEVLGLILQDAWTWKAGAAGACGYGLSLAVRYGVARGVFSNEAGLGSLAVLHGAADEATPETGGMWAMFEVFFDTIISCTLTALVILCAFHGKLPENGLGGAALTASAFSTRLGVVGKYLVSLSMAAFAFATIIAWYYLGRENLHYGASRTGIKEKPAEACYMFLYLAAVFLGCVGRLETVWELSDIWNGLMAVPNVIGLFFLRKQIPFPNKRRNVKGNSRMGR